MTALTITACVSYQPGTYNVQREFTSALRSDEAASKIGEWLVRNGFVVTHSSNALVSATSSNLDQLQGYSYDGWKGVAFSSPVCDCGRKPIGLGMAGGQLSISLRENTSTDSSGTIVLVNFAPTVNNSFAISCVSNGAIENTLRALLQGGR
ncbi:MAG: hypothetical protein FGM32_11445 [Candidatus Kapabacteria bacterium]|nr:hypothetical protein [Candidatus Kapabacteria bacterium]